MSARVFIADDHQVVRDGLKLLLERHQQELKVIGEAGNGIEALKGCLRLKPDIVIMDIGIPLLNGIEVTRRISKKLPDTRVIILSVYGDRETILAAIQAGARGYLLKEDAGEEVIKAIAQIRIGKSYISPPIASVILEDIRQNEIPSVPDKTTPRSLTSQEKQVLQLIAEGHSSKAISDILSISTHTVRSHRKNIMAKLDIHTVAGLTQFAIKKGFTGRG